MGSSECNRCAGEGVRYNNAAERVTTCGKCSKMEKICYHTEGTRAFLLEEDGSTICEIVAPAYNNRAKIAADLVGAVNANAEQKQKADSYDWIKQSATKAGSLTIRMQGETMSIVHGAIDEAAYAALRDTMWRIAGMDPTNSQAAILAKQEALDALEQAGER